MDYKEIIINGTGTASLGLRLLNYTIPMPEAKSNYVDVPGANGSLDMTDFFGQTYYNNREGITFTFDYAGDYEAWNKKLSEVARLCHGKRCRFYVDSDSAWYYTGRLAVTGQKTNIVNGAITITGNAEPFKYKQTVTAVTRTVSKRAVVALENAFCPVVPTITLSADLELVFNGVSYTISAGTKQVPGIVLKAGTNSITVIGDGTVQFVYQEAGL